MKVFIALNKRNCDHKLLKFFRKTFLWGWNLHSFTCQSRLEISYDGSMLTHKSFVAFPLIPYHRCWKLYFRHIAPCSNKLRVMFLITSINELFFLGRKINFIWIFHHFCLRLQIVISSIKCVRHKMNAQLTIEWY